VNLTIGHYALEIVAALAYDLAARAVGEPPSEYNFSDAELRTLVQAHGGAVVKGLNRRLPRALREAIVRQVRRLGGSPAQASH